MIFACLLLKRFLYAFRLLGWRNTLVVVNQGSGGVGGWVSSDISGSDTAGVSSCLLSSESGQLLSDPGIHAFISYLQDNSTLGTSWLLWPDSFIFVWEEPLGGTSWLGRLFIWHQLEPWGIANFVKHMKHMREALEQFWGDTILPRRRPECSFGPSS